MSSIQICGMGSRSVLVDNLPFKPTTLKLIINKRVKPKHVVYKLKTDYNIHQHDFKNANILATLDPTQQFFVYPIASFGLDGNRSFLERLDQQNKVPHKRFNIEASRVYVDVMPFAGESLYKLDEEEVKLTARQGRSAILNLAKGISLLHSHNMVHGDVHAHNVVLDIKGDAILARWIDFNEMKPIADTSHYLEFQKEAKRVSGMIRMIANLVEEEDEALSKLSFQLGRQVAPMSGMELFAQVKSFLGAGINEKRMRRTPSSSSRSSKKSVV